MNNRPLLLVALVASLGSPLAGVQAASPPAALQTAVVTAMTDRDASAYDGVVEAVRQTVVAAQVAGAIRSLDVKVGDRVKAGQVLARIDARTAEQTAAASDAQVIAARAALDLATRDFERQKRLFQQRFISQAALDRAEGELKSAQAQVNAQIALSLIHI